jgi:hypothetical protein
MPTWQPKWDDVMFDHAETNEAISLCRGALVTLADRHAVLQGPYEMACVNWKGVKRYRFDAEWAAMHGHAETVAEQLRAHIRRLGQESDSALVEQRQRENERARWFREKAAEDAAREVARVAAARSAALAAQQAAVQQAAAQQTAAHAAATAATQSAQAAVTAVAQPVLVFASIGTAEVTGSQSGLPVSTWNTATVPVAPGSVTPTSAPSTPAATFSPPATRASGQLSGR